MVILVVPAEQEKKVFRGNENIRATLRFTVVGTTLGCGVGGNVEVGCWSFWWLWKGLAMKRGWMMMLLVLWVMLFGGLTGYGAATTQPAELGAARVKAVLPAGWTLTSEKTTLIITRTVPAEWYGTVSMPSSNKAELKAMGFVHTGNYKIWVDFGPPMTAVAVAKLVAQNQQATEAYYLAHPVNPRVKPSGPPAEELTRQLQWVPNLLAKEYSALVTPSVTGTLAFYDAAVQLECMAVEAVVRQTLRAEASAFTITCTKPKDAVTETTSAERTIFTVSSPTGIGAATIERTAEAWPKQLVLRLKLRGLESLTIGGNTTKLSASVDSQTGKSRPLTMEQNGKEIGVRGGSPYWTELHALDAAGKLIKGLPDQDGYFEMVVPQAFLEEAGNKITLGWVDFYR
jgi:hypothetical protein